MFIIAVLPYIAEYQSNLKYSQGLTWGPYAHIYHSVGENKKEEKKKRKKIISDRRIVSR